MTCSSICLAQGHPWQKLWLGQFLTGCVSEIILTIIGGSCHKYHFSHDKCFVAKALVVTNVFLLWQNTSFVATKVCLLWQLLSWRNYICCDKILLAWQKLCRDKYLVWQTPVCCDKSFVVTKIILVLRQLRPVISVNLIWALLLHPFFSLKNCDSGSCVNEIILTVSVDLHWALLLYQFFFSPWHNCAGWPSVKHRVTYIPSFTVWTHCQCRGEADQFAR